MDDKKRILNVKSVNKQYKSNPQKRLCDYSKTEMSDNVSYFID